MERTEQTKKGLKYPFNKIFKNYENLINDTNHVKKLAKIEGFQNKLNGDKVK